MRCQECRHEWTPPPDRCPQCGAELQAMLPQPRLIDTRPLNDKAFLSLLIVFATFLVLQLTVYAAILPMISMALAILGLVEIRQSKRRMGGAGHAVIAIIVSLYFLLVGLPGLLKIFR